MLEASKSREPHVAKHANRRLKARWKCQGTGGTSSVTAHTISGEDKIFATGDGICDMIGRPIGCSRRSLVHEFLHD